MAAKKPPETLSDASKSLWGKILEEWAIEDPASLKTLEVGLLALDRAEKCRNRIDKDGEVVKDRFGQDKPHPLLASERDSRSQFLLAIKQLNLEVKLT